MWTGLFSSVRPLGWKDGGVLLTLNVDVSNKPATKELHLTKGHNGYISQVKTPPLVPSNIQGVLVILSLSFSLGGTDCHAGFFQVPGNTFYLPFGLKKFFLFQMCYPFWP